MHMLSVISVSLLMSYVPMLTGEMMANAAQEAKRTVAKQNKNKRRKAKAQAKASRQPPELDTTDSSGSETGTHGSSLDNDGYDTDEISYSKEQPFDYQGGADQAMEQD